MQDDIDRSMRANAWIAAGSTAQAIEGSAATAIQPCRPVPREASHRSSAALNPRTASRATDAA